MVFMDYLKLVTDELGISLYVLIGILIWSSIWKLLGLWKAARKRSVVWFIVLALINTMGILEILYIFVFSEMKQNNFRHRKAVKKRR